MKQGHIIRSVLPGSIAEELELEAGDVLLSINDKTIEDVFDYHYLVNDEELVLLVRKSDGEEWELEIEKDYDEDLGLEFEEGPPEASVPILQSSFSFLQALPVGPFLQWLSAVSDFSPCFPAPKFRWSGKRLLKSGSK